MRIAGYELFGIDTNYLCLGLVKSGFCSVSIVAVKTRVTVQELLLVNSKQFFVFVKLTKHKKLWGIFWEGFFCFCF